MLCEIASVFCEIRGKRIQCPAPLAGYAGHTILDCLSSGLVAKLHQAGFGVTVYLQEIDLFSSSSSLYIEFSLSFYCCHMKSFCNSCHSIFYSSIPNNLASPANLATSDYCLFCILVMDKIGPTVDPDGQPVVNIIMKIALFFPSIFFLLFYAITYLQDYSMVVYLFRSLR